MTTNTKPSEKSALSGSGKRDLLGSKPRQPLSLDTLTRSASHAQRSADPYNSSGSFDRTKNWARVGKR